MGEQRGGVARHSQIGNSATNHQERSSSNDITEDGKNIASQIVSTVNGEFSTGRVADKNNANEEWKLLALRLDKIFMISVIVVLIGTICYCAIQLKLYAENFNKDRSSLSNKVYRIL